MKPTGTETVTQHCPVTLDDVVHAHLQRLAQAAEDTGYLRARIEQYVPSVDLQYLVDGVPVAAIRVRLMGGTWRHEYPARLPTAPCTPFTQGFAPLDAELTDRHFAGLNYWWRTIPATGVHWPPRPNRWMSRVYRELTH